MPSRSTPPPKKRASAPTVKKAGAKISRSAASGQFVVGQERFARISAVEGIKLTPAMKKRAKDFDTRGLSSEERRREILKVYSKKT